MRANQPPNIKSILGAAAIFFAASLAESAVLTHETHSDFAQGSFFGVENLGTQVAIRLTYADLGHSLGDGRDGSVVLTSHRNINTESLGASSDRNGAWADGIAYRVNAPNAGDTSVTRASASVTLSNGINPGDYVLLINLRGSATDHGAVGRYELLKVRSVAADRITFDSTIANTYHSGTPSHNHVIIQRVPQYADVTIGSGVGLTAAPWDALQTMPSGNAGYYSGIVAFMANGTVTVNGDIWTDGAGYRGGWSVGRNSHGIRGEGYADGYGVADRNAFGTAGGGGHCCQDSGGGGGGGHGSAGTKGQDWGPHPGGNGGQTWGTADMLNALNFGGGGGSGGGDEDGACSGAGGRGGGIVYIRAKTLNVGSGHILARGRGGANACSGCCGCGMAGGGGGAGGSIMLIGENLNLSSGRVMAYGLGGGANNGCGGAGGAGGMGRVAVYRLTSLSGTSEPAFHSGTVTYRTNGVYRSAPIEFTRVTAWGQMTWTFSGGGTLRARTRTAATETGLATAAWSSWLPVSGLQIESDVLPWLQYEIEWSASGGGSPVLHLVSIGYNFNRQPNSPANPNPPDGGLTNRANVMLTWTVSDPEGDPLTNYVTISTNANLSNPLVASTNVGAATHYLTAALADGMYYWMVRSADAFGPNMTSAVWRFTVDTTPPIEPRLLAEQRNAAGLIVRLDGVAESNATLEVLSGAGVALAGTLTWTSPTSFTYALEQPLNEGASATLRSTDAAGNVATSSAPRVFAATRATVPSTIDVQMRAFLADGAAISGVRDIEWRLYRVETGGVATLTQRVTAVQFENGLANVSLSHDHLASALKEDAIWLETRIGETVFEPRQRLLSVPYALHAREAHEAQIAVAAMSVEGPTLFVDPASQRVGIGTQNPDRKLKVIGDAGGHTAWYNDSDGALKTDIRPLEYGLDDALRLRGVYFRWLPDGYPDERQLGLIAQEVEAVAPEAVRVGEDGLRSVAPDLLIPILIEAIKERQVRLDAERQRLDRLEAEMSK
jgi:hypothetical protein